MKRYTGIVLRKEILDIVRDRRSLITALLVPILLYPMMFGLMGSFVNNMNREAETNTTVMVEGPAGMEEYLMQTVFGGIPGIVTLSFDDAAEALENGDVKIVLQFGPNALDDLRNGRNTYMKLVYDDNKSASVTSSEYVLWCFRNYNDLAVTQKLAEIDISLEALRPFAVSAITVDELTDKQSNRAGMMLSMMLPMLITIYLSVGGMSVAIDIFAGEKERHTMEALLCTRAGRNEILIGKFTALVIYSLVAVVSSGSGIVIAYVAFPEMMNMGAEDIIGGTAGFSIPWQSAVFTVLSVAVLAMTFAAIQVIISCWARTTKEAGTYVTFMMIVSYIPIFATMMMQPGDFGMWSAFVPVLNTIGCMKMVLGGIADYAYMGVTLGMSAVFLLMALAGTRVMFKNENIMLRG